MKESVRSSFSCSTHTFFGCVHSTVMCDTDTVCDMSQSPIDKQCQISQTLFFESKWQQVFWTRMSVDYSIQVAVYLGKLDLGQTITVYLGEQIRQIIIQGCVLGSVLEVLRRSKNIAIGPKDTRSYFIRFRPSSEIVVSSTQNFLLCSTKINEHEKFQVLELTKILETFLELKIELEFDRKRWKGIGRGHVEFRHHPIHTFSNDEEIFIRIEFRTFDYGTVKN